VLKFNPKGTGTIAAVMQRNPAPIRALMKTLMARIRKLEPKAMRAAYPSWNIIMFGHAGNAFCYIGATKRGAHLSFINGTMLADRYRLLEGKAKYVRRIEIPTGKRDIQWAAIDDLVQQALRLNLRASRLRALVEE